MIQRVNQRILLFDLLLFNGTSCLEYPLEKRKHMMEDYFPDSNVVEKVTGQVIKIKDDSCCDEISRLLKFSVSKGLEGLFVKALGPKTHYDSSSRTQWAKVFQG
jgi:ATP-dependent DNA ligase